MTRSRSVLHMMGRLGRCGIMLSWLTLGLGLVPRGSLAQANGWMTSCVDCPKSIKDLTTRALQLDASGLPHVVYGGDHLYYAWHDGTNWHYEVADASPGVGRYASLAMDSDGHPHVSYTNGAKYALKYAYRDDHGWRVETVDGEGQPGLYTSIALDNEGNPHISYGCIAGRLKHAYRDANGWHVELVEQQIEVAGTSIALDIAQNPHILYYVSPFSGGYELRYAYRDAGGWHTETVDEPDDTGTSVSLVIGADGRPYISYANENYYEPTLKYGYKDASGWNISVIDSGGQSLRYHPSLALDRSGYPHMAFVLWDPASDQLSELRYIHQDRFGWHVQTVESQGALSPSLMLDSQGRPHITYLSQDNLRYTYQNALGWHGEPVDQAIDVGEDVSLVVDDNSVLHVTYFDRTDNRLKYAYSTADGWQIETAVDIPVGTSVRYLALTSSLALDGEGRPCLSYYDSGSHTVCYACRTSEGWQTEVIDSISLTTMRGTSLAFDKAGYPHVSYRGRYSLQYASRDENGWQTESLETSCPYCGAYSSLALDESGNPHISYADIYSNRFKYSYKDQDGWHTEVVRSCGSFCKETMSLRLDADQRPHISFIEGHAAGSYLDYAYKDSDGTWHVETAPGYSYVDTSLSLDADGNAHIVYEGSLESASGANELIHAYWDGTGWQQEIIDYAAKSQSTALALSGSGNLFVAYQDYLNKDVRWAFYGPVYSSYLPTVGRRQAQ